MSNYIENAILVGVVIILAGLAYMFITSLLSSTSSTNYQTGISPYFVPPMPQMLRIVQDYSTATTQLQVYLNREYNGDASLYVKDVATRKVLAGTDMQCSGNRCLGRATDSNIPVSDRYVVRMCIGTVCIENEVSAIFEELVWPIGQAWMLWKVAVSTFIYPGTQLLNEETNSTIVTYYSGKPNKEVNTTLLYSSTVDLNTW